MVELNVDRRGPAEAADHQLGGLVVPIRPSFSLRERLQIGPQINEQLGIVTPLFLAVLPSLVPTSSLDADKDAKDDYDEVERHGEPVLGFRMLD